ncbi:hypothetical protein [Sulfurovum mangrovi]|uniref:hypothetical protein n=1 Tax=Sulfurovum mangrovi TaxID=2893889 RepID=UPI001E539CAC|nr:hypothetical protein [Sulfurovum mangrovi]UFH60467.1 hypothetical protein LN246_06315 [Sulfurovum mangrovi]
MHNKSVSTEIKDFCSQLDTGTINAKTLLNKVQIAQIDFFWHPLGFIIGTYLNNGREKIRIHIWPKDGGKKQLPYWNIHDHIFDLKSWVLKGEITNIEYDVINDNSSTKCFYDVKYIENQSLMTKSEQHISYKISKKETYAEGEIYTIDAGIFHTSEKTNIGNALTVVLSINTDIKTPKVIGEEEGENSYQYNRNKVDSSYIKELINEF